MVLGNLLVNCPCAIYLRQQLLAIKLFRNYDDFCNQFTGLRKRHSFQPILKRLSMIGAFEIKKASFQNRKAYPQKGFND
jgi:hypothetical protein